MRQESRTSAVLIGALMASGCLQGGPTQPDDPIVGPGGPCDLPAGLPNVDSTGASLIGCAGSLDVPERAVASPISVDLTPLTAVRVSLPQETEWFATLPCSLTPHDTVFAERARVELPFDRTFPRGGSVTNEELIVARLDSCTDTTWEPVSGNLEFDGDRVRFWTEQLGIFAVLRPKDVGLDSLPFIPTFAAVLSDFSSTAIALLNEEGRVLRNAWIDSGTQVPILNATISGDVVLPTTQPAGQLTLIDRFGVDVVSRFTVPGGELIGQVRAQPTDPDVAIAFSTNPYDFAYVDERSGWVTRYSPGPPPDQGGDDPMNRGNDLLEIDPRDMIRTGRTIDMSRFNSSVTKADDSIASVPARPTHIVQIGNFLVVSLNRQSVAFDAADTGALAIVDLRDSSVALHEMPPFQNCDQISSSPEDPAILFVSCVGFAIPFGEESQVRASAGVAVVTVDPDTGEVTQRPGLTLADEPLTPLVRATAVALSSTEFVAVASGDFAGTGDRLYYVDLEGDEPLLVAESEAFALGRSAYDPETGLLLVPDGSSTAPGIRRFRRTNDGFDELETELVDPALGPRQIYRLSP